MLIQKAVNIKAGYVVEIESWENDADDYYTIRHTGLTAKDVEFFRLVCPYMAHGTTYSNENFGEGLAYLLWELVRDNIHLSDEFKKWIDVDIDTFNEEEEIDDGIMYDIRYKIQENITADPVNYDTDFIRVVSSLYVAHIEEDIVIPEVSIQGVETVYDWRTPIC